MVDLMFGDYHQEQPENIVNIMDTVINFSA